MKSFSRTNYTTAEEVNLSALLKTNRYRFGEARLEEMHPGRKEREEDQRCNIEAIERRAKVRRKRFKTQGVREQRNGKRRDR